MIKKRGYAKKHQIQVAKMLELIEGMTLHEYCTKDNDHWESDYDGATRTRNFIFFGRWRRHIQDQNREFAFALLCFKSQGKPILVV